MSMSRKKFSISKPQHTYITYMIYIICRWWRCATTSISVGGWELYKFSLNIIGFLTFYLSCQPRSGHRRKSCWYFLDKISRKFSHLSEIEVCLNRIEYWLVPSSKKVSLEYISIFTKFGEFCFGEKLLHFL